MDAGTPDRLGADLVMHFHGESYRVKYTRFLHHDGSEEVPEWLRQWTERNPLDDVALGRSSKLGWLPYLEHPYSQK